MALSGRLDDMNLMEILQIVAFSKKSGTLTVEKGRDRGAVLFLEGRVQCALASGTKEALHRLSRDTFDASRVAQLQETIRAALAELVRLREGSFEFSLFEEAPLLWEGLDAGNFLVTEGVDPEMLLLDLARELDESRREAGESAGAERAETSFPSSAFTVLIVDDEEQVSRAVAEAIASTGTTVETAAGTDEALELVRHLHASGRPTALVTDIGMPSSDGESFLGGLELAEQVREIDPELPILLTAEALTARARTRARQLGISKVTFKPALTKLDPDEYESDLAQFAAAVIRGIEELVSAEDDRSAAAPPPLNLEAIFAFLRQMTEQLHHPGNAIARMILRVASKFAERALILLVKGSRAHGLAGVELGRGDRQVSDTVRRIDISLQDTHPFAEVVYTRKPVRSQHEPNLVPPEIPVGRATEFALLPLVLKNEVVAIVYIDNPGTGRKLNRLSGLEMFLAQAGMAMDNASLHRKLRAAEMPFSLDNQGPLTQELSRVLPSTK